MVNIHPTRSSDSRPNRDFEVKATPYVSELVDVTTAFGTDLYLGQDNIWDTLIFGTQLYLGFVYGTDHANVSNAFGCLFPSIDELNSPQNVTEDLKLIVSWKSLFVETGLSICAALMTLRLYNNSRPTKTD